jgi:hypothetical protein
LKGQKDGCLGGNVGVWMIAQVWLMHELMNVRLVEFLEKYLQ